MNLSQHHTQQRIFGASECPNLQTVRTMCAFSRWHFGRTFGMSLRGKWPSCYAWFKTWLFLNPLRTMVTNEPPHDKTNVAVHPVKTQISLGIRHFVGFVMRRLK